MRERLPVVGDDGIANALARVSRPEWAELWAAVDDVTAEADHDRTRPSDHAEPPTHVVEHVEYSDRVKRLCAVLDDLGLVASIHGFPWERLQQYGWGDAIKAVPVVDAVWVLTGVLRRERLVAGSIEQALRDGTLLAALSRLRTWSET